MPIDKSQLADVRKLLGDHDATTVRQGLEILRALEDRDLWEVIARGVEVTAKGRVSVPDGCEVHRRVRSAHRLEVALWALRGAGRLDAREHLDLSSSGLSTLRALAGLPRLEVLDVSGCNSLDDLDGMADCPALRSLDLSNARITNVDALAGCSTLEALNLAGCSSLTDIGALASCAALTTLSLRDNRTLTNFDVLGRCTNLTTLHLDSVRGLTSVDMLRSCARLTTLTLNGCDRLTDVDALEACGSLTVLGLRRTKVPTVFACATLQSLDFRSFTRVTLPDLRGCADLRKLFVNDMVTARAAFMSLGLSEEEFGLTPVAPQAGAVKTDPWMEALVQRGFATRPAYHPYARETEGVELRVDAMRAYVEARRASHLPRTLAAAEAPELGDRDALRALNAAFRGAKCCRDALPVLERTPRDTLIRICGAAGLRVSAEGVLVWDESGGLRLPRLTLRGEILLLLADATGLLDGLAYLSMAADPHATDLGALVRHAPTLRFLRLREGHVFGPELAKRLRSELPLPAPGSADVRAHLLRHLLGDAPEDARAAAALAATNGQLDGLLEGCHLGENGASATLARQFAPPCSVCDGTGRRGTGTCATCRGDGRFATPSGDPALRILTTLLAAAPRGSPAAQAVVAGITSLRFDPPAHLPWLHHAVHLHALTLPWTELAAHLPVVAELPALTRVEITGEAPAIADAVALLRALPHLTAVSFASPVPLALLAALGLTTVTTATAALFGCMAGSTQVHGDLTAPLEDAWEAMR